MPRLIQQISISALLIAALSGQAQADSALDSSLDSSLGPLQITRVADGLQEPWGIAFLPDGRFFVTERNDGRLRLYEPDGGRWAAVRGLARVHPKGQGGLLDVMIPRDFATSRAVYITYAKSLKGGSGTALARGTLSEDGARLNDFTVLFEMPMGNRKNVHFGARVIEAQDGTLYLAMGEKGTGPDDLAAQDPASALGKVVHLNPDGSPATTLAGALPGIHTLGHRNPQGLVQSAKGAVILVEHGPQGGDEVNILRQGGNYGWPLVTQGEQYGGGDIGQDHMAGMVEPEHVWIPSIAPSGLMEYTGSMFPEWRGDLFTGSLNSDFIARLDPPHGYGEERLAAPETGRVRDIVQAPDGSIWFLSVADGAIYRIARPK